MKVIFFARYSVLQCLVLAPEIRATERIQFQIYTRSITSQNLYFKLFVKKLIALINNNCIIEESNLNLKIEDEWKANRESMDLIDSYRARYKKNGIVIFLSKVIRSEKVIKYFQGTLTYYLPSQLIFENVVIKNITNENILCIPSWELTNKLNLKLGQIRVSILKVSYVLNQVIKNLFNLLAVLFFPLFYLLVRLRRGLSFTYIDSKKYHIAMPVLWGFNTNGKNIRNGVSKPIDDSYLYGNGIKPGDIVHIFGKWNHSLNMKSKYLLEMKKLGYKHTNKSNFKISPKFLLILLRTQLKILFFMPLFFIGNKVSQESVVLSKSLIKALYYFFEKNLELTNIKYKVELVKDDYNPGHVINSIVSRKYKVVTFGVQHAGTSLDAPQLNFVEFDYYSIWGDFYAKAFKKGWERINLVETGREIIDFVVSNHNNKNKVNRTNEFLDQNYGSAKYRILFLFSGPTSLTNKLRWDELYKGFKLVSRLKMDFQFICRFRNEEHQKHPYIKNISELISSDSRFILEQQNFTTQELMCIADLIITPNTSFGINEALVIGKKVYTFDLLGNALLTFKKYGKEIVIESANEFVNVVEGLENNFQNLEYDSYKLAQELNYHSDGLNCERLRKEILIEINKSQ